MYNKTKSDSRKYLITSIVMGILDVIRGIFVVNLLGPYLSGLCTALLVIPQVSQYLYGGLINAMTVLVPAYNGKGNLEKSRVVRNSVINITSLISCISFLFVFLYLFLKPSDSFEFNVFVILAGGLIIIWQAQKFFLTIFVTEHNFKKLIVIELSFSFLVTLSQIVLIYFFKGIGFWLGLISSGTLVVVYLTRDYLRKHEVALFKIDLEETKKMVPLAITMVFSGVAYVPFVILTKTFLANTAGALEVGFFVPSMMIISRMWIISGAIGRVIFPRISQLQAEMDNLTGSFHLFKRAQLYTLFVSLSAFALGMILMPKAVSIILPRFTPGIPAAKMALIAGIPYCLIDNANNYLQALQYKRAYLINLAGSIFFQFIVLGYLFFNKQISAYNMSVGLFLVFLFYAIVVNITVFQTIIPKVNKT